MTTKTRVAALQMQGRTGDIAYNLDHVRELLAEAVRSNAKVVSVPEFFTTSIVENPRLWQCSLPPENDALELLRSHAVDHQALVGGSYLEKRGDDVFNCYILAHPDGSVTRHDKDLPTMIENAYYIGGDDDGLHQTELGRVGTAVCWETIRTQTVHRMANKVDFLMTGSHWWSPPHNWPMQRVFLQPMSVMNSDYMEQAPGALARMLGVANMHGAHCGALEGKIPLLPGLPSSAYRGELMGETQIIDNSGKRVARMHRSEGPGVITADIELTPVQPTQACPERFWIPELALRFRFFWWQQNLCGKALYRKARANKLLKSH